MNKPNVSVIIPAYNAQDTIDECLDSILNVQYPKELLEVLVVDDGSQDATREKVDAHEGVKLVLQKHGGPAAARNRGFKESTGDIVVFTDSDCIAPREWIKNLVAEMESEDVAGGSLKPASTDTEAERFEQERRDRLYGNQRRYVKALPSCNLAFKKEVLEEVGGFDEEFRYASAEDYELCARVTSKGYKILYEPSIEVLHKHSHTTSGIFKRAYVHGREIMLYRKKQGENIFTELVRLPAKAALIPYYVLTRYHVNMAHIGAAYETLSLFGNIRGYLKYRVNI